MDEICGNCGAEKSHHHINCGNLLCYQMKNDTVFAPSGRVSVPVEFIEAVREYFSKPAEDAVEYRKKISGYRRIRAMLKQMKGADK